LQFPLGNLAGSALEIAKRSQGPASGQSDRGGIEMDRFRFGKQGRFGFFGIGRRRHDADADADADDADDDDDADDADDDDDVKQKVSKLLVCCCVIFWNRRWKVDGDFSFVLLASRVIVSSARKPMQIKRKTCGSE
jgi:hypothetical protein